jgi:hypothetical protein
MKKAFVIRDGVMNVDLPDDPHARDALLEAIAFMQAVERMERGTRNGGKGRGAERHLERETRDNLIADIVATYTGESRNLAGHVLRQMHTNPSVIKRMNEESIKPIKIAAVRIAVKRLQARKRSVA